MKDISDSLLIQLAGKPAFGRGEVYYRQGRVAELRLKGKTIIALVEGSETYEVRLKHTSKVFEGSCDCPASDGFDFCKHCVAVAMVYRESQQQEAVLREAPSKDRLPSYLMTLEKSALVDMLLTQLKNDRSTLAQLQVKADLSAGKLTITSLKKQITAATPINRHLFDYSKVRRYFESLDTVLESLQPVLPSLSSDKTLALIDYTFERIDKALETIDDSGGFRYDALERLSELHLNTLATAGMPVEALVDYLYQLFLKPAYELYPAIPASYEAMLGEQGQQLFLNRVRRAWDALPPLQDRDADNYYDYFHLRVPLEQWAESQGDGETLIALHAKTASDFGDYLRLSELCLKHKLPEQALWWRKRAQADTPQPYHAKQSLQDNQINIWRYHKDYESIVALLWERFAAAPSVKCYQAIVTTPGQKNSEQNKIKAIELTQGVVATTKKPHVQYVVTESLAELHLLFKQPAQALLIAETHKLSRQLLVKIASANTEKPDRGLPLIYRAARAAIDQSNNEGYREAIDYLLKAQTLAGKQCQASFQETLQGLLQEYKRKRNFCQWLREAFTGV